MNDILAKICSDKADHVARKKSERSLNEVEAAARAASAPRGFADALFAAKSADQYGFICEIKKASPSKGLIRPDFDPPSLARAYEAGGAACLSVLTDEPYFQGHDDYLVAARAEVSLPCLRKDFMIDPFQVPEARALGADCILLIIAALSDTQAAELESAALEWGMDVLLEVHDRAELDRALSLQSRLLGVNNRNLKTMTVSLENTIGLAPHVPRDKLLVCESGLKSAEDLATAARSGASTFLIGETFMLEDDVAEAVRRMQKTGAGQ